MEIPSTTCVASSAPPQKLTVLTLVNLGNKNLPIPSFQPAERGKQGPPGSPWQGKEQSEGSSVGGSHCCWDNFRAEKAAINWARNNQAPKSACNLGMKEALIWGMGGMWVLARDKKNRWETWLLPVQYSQVATDSGQESEGGGEKSASAKPCLQGGCIN